MRAGRGVAWSASVRWRRSTKALLPSTPLVPLVRLPPAAEDGDGGPPIEAPDESPALEVRPAALRDARDDEGAVGVDGPPPGGRELRKHGLRVLPWSRDHTQQALCPVQG